MVQLVKNRTAKVIEGHIIYQLGNEWHITRYNYPLHYETDPLIEDNKYKKYWDHSIVDNQTDEQHLEFFNQNNGIRNIIYEFDLDIDNWLCGVNDYEIVSFHSVSYSNEVGMLDGGFHNAKDTFSEQFRTSVDAVKSVFDLTLNNAPFPYDEKKSA